MKTTFKRIAVLFICALLMTALVRDSHARSGVLTFEFDGQYWQTNMSEADLMVILRNVRAFLSGTNAEPAVALEAVRRVFLARGIVAAPAASPVITAAPAVGGGSLLLSAAGVFGIALGCVGVMYLTVTPEEMKQHQAASRMKNQPGFGYLDLRRSQVWGPSVK